MGLMTALVTNYVYSPLSGLWSALEHFTMVVGYSRAAAELARMGYHSESKALMMELGKLSK